MSDRPPLHLALRWLIPCTAMVVSPSTGSAQQPSALPYSLQTQVNVTVAGYQGGPAVAAVHGGGWVVVWVDQGGEDAVIRARRFDRVGSPTGGELTLATLASAGDPAVARLDDGRFVTVWRNSSPPAVRGSNPGIEGRFLSAAGQPTGSIFTVHADPSPLGAPDVEATTGGFVAAWSDDAGIWVRRFGSNGQPVAPAQQADTLEGDQRNARLARLERDRGTVLVWQSSLSAGGDTSERSVQWRRLDQSGSFVGAEQQANRFTVGDQLTPDVAATPDGGFAIVWRSVSSPGATSGAPEVGEPSGDGIDLRFFGAAGVPRDNGATISTDGGLVTREPALARGPDGELLATWVGANDEVRARRSAPWPMALLGAELRLDDFTGAEGLQYPRLGIDAQGDFAAVWESYIDSPGGDDSDGSAQLRTFTIGRVARWTLEEPGGEIAGDDAGRVADQGLLAAGGDPAWSTGRGGAGALQFDGAGFVDVSPSLDLDLADPGLTLAAWIRLELAPSALPEAFSSIFDSSQDNYVLYLDRAAAELRFKVTVANGTTARPGIPEGSLPIGRWIHVAGVYSGDGTASIYLDGALADLAADPGLIGPVRSNPAQVSAIGRDGVNDRYYLEGRLDALEVWRRALHGEEVRLFRGRWIFGDDFEAGGLLAWPALAPGP